MHVKKVWKKYEKVWKKYENGVWHVATETYNQKKDTPTVTKKYGRADKVSNGGQNWVLMSTWSVRRQSNYEKHIWKKYNKSMKKYEKSMKTVWKEYKKSMKRVWKVYESMNEV